MIFLSLGLSLIYKQISENYKDYLSFSLSMWLKRHVNWEALYCNWKREREL